MAKPSRAAQKNAAIAALGAAIRAAREQQGLSQERLAIDAGIDRSYMGGIERGEHNVAFIYIEKIAKVLGIKISELMIRAGI